MSDKHREIPLSEVEQHSSEESCWFVMNDKVYDVTAFLAEHPGGCDVLLEQAGKNATEAFDDIGHSKDAKEMSEEYIIGKLQTSTTGSATKSDSNCPSKQ